MFTRTFWLSASERALKTGAQVLVVFLGADVVNAFAVDYERAAGIALGGVVVSYLTSVVSAPAGDTGTPSLVGEDH
jgi:orotate phosphoribosyltransferase